MADPLRDAILNFEIPKPEASASGAQDNSAFDPLRKAIEDFPVNQPTNPPSPEATTPDPMRQAIKSFGNEQANDNQPEQNLDESLPLPALDEAATPPRPGYVEAFKGGVRQGVAKFQSDIPTLKGMYAEATGDQEAAQQYGAEAKAIEDAQPAPIVGSLSDIHNLDDFGYWTAEKLGEQAPILASMLVTGGLGGLVAGAAGRGLLLNPANMTRLVRVGQVAGAGVSNVGIETAGTAAEQQQATGSFHPELSISAGLLKGALESYVPFKFLKEFSKPGFSILGEAVKTAGREAITEGLQEQVDILARTYSDPNYHYFTTSMVMRTAEAMAAGAISGGVYSGGIGALGKAVGLSGRGPAERPLTAEEINRFPTADEPEAEPQTGPLTWLRNKWQSRSSGSTEQLPPDVPAVDDVLESSVVAANLKRDWVRTGIQQQQIDDVVNFVDDNTPRYVMTDESGKLGTKLLTDTDMEREMALQPNRAAAPRIIRADLQSLQPAGITAQVRDLPEPNSNRIYFLPGVLPAEQETLRSKYENLYSAHAQDWTMLPEVEAVAQEEYQALLDKGLRVVPSPGSSFHYNAQMQGTEITQVPASRRTVQIAWMKPGSEIPRFFGVYSQPGPGMIAVAIDMNKVPKDSLRMLNEDGALIPYDPKSFNTLAALKELPKEAIIPGISMPEFGLRRLRDINLKNSKGGFLYVESETAPIQVKNRAKEIVGVLQKLQPKLDELYKILGIKNHPTIVLDEGLAGGPEVNPGENAIFLPVRFFTTDKAFVKFTTGDLNFDITNIIIHELGHIIAYRSWDVLPVAIQQQVYNGYQRALLNYRLTGDTSRVQAIGNPEVQAEWPTHAKTYYLSFSEYLAEQFRRWATSDAAALTHSDEFFRRVAAKRDQLYREYIRTVGADNAKSMILSDYSFNSYMEYLELVAKGPENPALLMAEAQKLQNYRTPLTLVAAENLVQREIRNLRHLIPLNLTIKTDPATEIDPETGLVTLAEIDPLKRTVRFLVGSIAQHDAPTDAVRRALGHENFHAIEDVLTPEERQILVEAGRREKSMTNEEIGFYYRTFAEQFRRAGLDPHAPENQAGIRYLMESETMAHMVDQRVNGKIFGGWIDQVLDVLIEAIQRISNGLRGLGFKTADDIMRAFYKGELTNRYDEAQTNRVLRQYEQQSAETQPPKDFTFDIQRSSSTQLNVKIKYKKKEIGQAYIREMMGGPSAIQFGRITMDEEHQRKGVGTALMHELEDKLGKPMIPDFTLSNAEYARWQKIDPEAVKEYRRVSDQNWIGQPNRNTARMEQIRAKGPQTQQVVEVGKGLHEGEIGERISPELIAVWSKTSGGIYWQFRILSNDGEEKGYLALKNTAGSLNLGYDVEMIRVYRSAFGQNIPQQLIDFAEKKLGQKLKPSGTLTEAGYKMIKRVNPLLVATYVHDTRTGMWLSPNRIQESIDRLQSWKDAGLAPQLKHWEDLKSRIPEFVWKDPDLHKKFMVERREGTLRDVSRAQDITENQLMKSVVGTTTGPVQSDFDDSHDTKVNESQQRNADILGLKFEEAAPKQAEHVIMDGAFLWYKKGEHDPKIRAMLDGMSGESDRISKFSKLFFGLQQIVWRNEHLEPARNYLSLTEQLSTRMMSWISRADEVARDWDRLPELQRNALSDIMFWATEMNYRTAAEANQGVIRQPTMVELQTAANRLGMTQATFALYPRVQKEFNDFLDAVASQSIAQINKIQSVAIQQVQLSALQKDMAQMKARPYFPMTRFGEFTITVRDPTSRQVLWFSAYPTLRERDAAVRQVSANHPGGALSVGKMPEEVQEFMGLPAPLLRMIKSQLPGISQAQLNWFDQLQLMTAPEKSFRKRWLSRKGTPGYSLDGVRAFSQYFQSGARYLSRLEFKDPLQEQIGELEKTVPFLRDSTKRRQIIDYMQKHLNYIMEGGRDWSKLKGAIATFQLGGSVAAAGMNLLQPAVTTLPYLSRIYGDAQALRGLIAAINAGKQSFGFPLKNASPAFIAAREEAIAQGKIDTGQAPELGSFAEGGHLSRAYAGTSTQRFWRQFSYWSMIGFTYSERINRESTFKAAWDLAIANPQNKHLQLIGIRRQQEVNDLQARRGLTVDEAIAFLSAREAVDRTQFIYQPWARPPFLRSGPASTFLIFFSYTQNMLYALANNPGAGRMWLTMMFLYGVAGLPGAEDLDRIIRILGRKFFGADFSVQNEARKLIREMTTGTIFDQVGADLMLHGVSRFSFGFGLLPEGWGIPRFDASANGSMGKLIPGLSDTLRTAANGGKWKDLTAGLAQDISGAGFGQMFAWLQFMTSDPFSADQKKWEKILPRAVKGISKAYRYYDQGKEVTNQGGTFAKFDMKDPDDRATVITQALGFTPQKISTKYEALGAAKDTIAWYTSRRANIFAEYDQALQSKDPQAILDMNKAKDEFDKDAVRNGFPSMVIGKELLVSLKTRARGRVMRGADLPIQKSQIPVQRKVMEDYPLVQKVR